MPFTSAGFTLCFFAATRIMLVGSTIFFGSRASFKKPRLGRTARARRIEPERLPLLLRRSRHRLHANAGEVFLHLEQIVRAALHDLVNGQLSRRTPDVRAVLKIG